MAVSIFVFYMQFDIVYKKEITILLLLFDVVTAYVHQIIEKRKETQRKYER